MLTLEPKLAILDETDSGLDVDAVRTVSEGVRLFREKTHGSLLIITHSTRILEALRVDRTHVMENGVISVPPYESPEVLKGGAIHAEGAV